MKSHGLKKSRIILATLFLLLLLSVFIDFRKSFSAGAYQAILFFQFVPSLLKMITLPGVMAIGFLLVLLLTLLGGRVYCSVICPLGILQDLLARLPRRKKKRYRYKKGWTKLRIFFLVLVTLPLLLGSMTLLSLIDPYSLFGRIAFTLIKPLVVFLNNGMASGLATADVYSWLYRYDMVLLHPILFLTTLVASGVVVWTSYFHGRLYCNTVCPVGTVLGFLSRFALFKIVLHRDKCTRCGNCAKVCKAECIDLKTQEIDYSRCIACYNCLGVCEEHGIAYRPKGPKGPVAPGKSEGRPNFRSVKPDLSKRSFMIMGLAGMATLYGFQTPAKVEEPKKKKLIKPKGQSKIPEKKSSPVSPPGSVAIDRFNSICTGCSLCVAACPTKVLQPAFMDYGLIGFMQPHMSYHHGLCEFDCTLCSDVCPTGAIIPLTVESKHRLQIGQVQFEKQNCVVETEKTDCGACSEHCPTKAVQMVPYGALFIPQINQKICVGCGACEFACPTTPFKAIYVNGNPKHLTAEKPVTEKAKNTLKEGEFPF